MRVRERDCRYLDSSFLSITRMAEKEANVAVVDLGTSSIKVGLQGDDTPRDIIPTVVGYPAGLTAHIPGQDDSLEACCGSKALEAKGLLRLKYPLRRGVCETKEDLENLGKVLKVAHYDSLSISPDETNFVITVPALCSWKHLKNITNHYLEECKAPSIAFHNQGVLTMMGLYARTTGVFVDCGHGMTQTVPIFGGYALPCAMQRTNLAGADLDDYMRRLLMQEGRTFETGAERALVREIKESGSVFVSDEEFNMATSKPIDPKPVELPDGSKVKLKMSLTQSQAMCAEALFNPEIIGRQMGGIQHSVVSAIEACPMDIRGELVKDIHVSGGTSMLEGFGERLNAEIQKLLPHADGLKVHEKETRQMAVFQGAAAMAEVGEQDENFWITSKEYSEHGENIVYRKGRGLL